MPRLVNEGVVSKMSRLAKKPIALSGGVEVKEANREVTIKGPKGQLSLTIHPGIILKQEGTEVSLSAEEDIKNKALLGLEFMRLKNAVTGVTTGFKKELELVGVGFRAAVKGNALELSLGFSHPCSVAIPQGIQVKVEKNTQLTVEGADKQELGQFCATVRMLKPPEPYKGKGIRYAGEQIRRKAGKKSK